MEGYSGIGFVRRDRILCCTHRPSHTTDMGLIRKGLIAPYRSGCCKHPSTSIFQVPHCISAPPTLVPRTLYLVQGCYVYIKGITRLPGSCGFPRPESWRAVASGLFFRFAIFSLVWEQLISLHYLIAWLSESGLVRRSCPGCARSRRFGLALLALLALRRRNPTSALMAIICRLVSCEPIMSRNPHISIQHHQGTLMDTRSPPDRFSAFLRHTRTPTQYVHDAKRTLAPSR